MNADLFLFVQLSFFIPFFILGSYATVISTEMLQVGQNLGVEIVVLSVLELRCR